MFNTELIYTRVVGIQASSREIDIKQLLSYELSPVPTAMFSESDEMKIAKAKSILKKVLQKDLSSRCIKKTISTVVKYGSAIYLLPWSASSATVEDFVVKIRNYNEKLLQSFDVYLLFNRYREYSTKSVTRGSHWAQLSLVHHLITFMPTKGYPNYS